MALASTGAGVVYGDVIQIGIHQRIATGKHNFLKTGLHCEYGRSRSDGVVPPFCPRPLVVASLLEPFVPRIRDVPQIGEFFDLCGRRAVFVIDPVRSLALRRRPGDDVIRRTEVIGSAAVILFVVKPGEDLQPTNNVFVNLFS